MEGIVRCDVPVVDFGKPRNWHELSPVADASRLQDSEVGGIFSDRLCHAGARGRADFLGGDASNSSSEFRYGGGSAFADRRQMVGAHGLDSDGQVDASRYDYAGPLRPGPGQRQVSCLDYEISLRSDDC